MVPTTTHYRFSYIKSEHDWEEYQRLLQVAFAGEGVDILARRLWNDHPVMTSSNFFSLWDGDKMVATLNLIPQTWSLGGIKLKVAEMGLVASDPAYRNRGLQRILNKQFDKRLREDGYHLAVIEGIPFFYRQFGYEYSIPLDDQALLPLQNLPKQLSYVIAPLAHEDVPNVMKLLEASQKKYLVHSIRSREEWIMQERTGHVGESTNKTYIVKRKGSHIAYFRATIKDAVVILHEINDTDEETSKQIAAFLRKLGEENGSTELASKESYDAPFNKYLSTLGSTEKQPYAWQVKVVDPFRVLTAITKVFEERVAQSQYQSYTGLIPINLYGVTITITFTDGLITGVKQNPSEQRGDIMINPRIFSKMLLGYRSLDELESEYLDVRIKPEYRELVSILFPKTKAHIHTCY
jgi:predicted N-acetyltransferase YhbS